LLLCFTVQYYHIKIPISDIPGGRRASSGLAFLGVSVQAAWRGALAWSTDFVKNDTTTHKMGSMFCNLLPFLLHKMFQSFWHENFQAMIWPIA
jgi:hypothetical protein